jgi:hypothetical protein
MKRVYISYAHEDAAFRDSLITHLEVLRAAGAIATWHDGRLAPGEDWQATIDRELRAADIVVLLISANFLASKSCQELELAPALNRWRQRQVLIIPVIVRACDWEASAIASLQVLPAQAKPIATWPHPDDAWLEVTRKIRVAAIDPAVPKASHDVDHLVIAPGGTSMRRSPSGGVSESSTPATSPSHPPPTTERPRAFEYDVALSFAGEDRGHAEAIAELLKDRGVRVFYDLFEQAALWGKDLYQHLQTVYRDQARFCVIFVSAAYAKKLWTRHELQQAQARALTENAEYILPVRLDQTALPGLNFTIGYLDGRAYDATTIVDMLLKKLMEPVRLMVDIRAGLADQSPEARARALLHVAHTKDSSFLDDVMWLVLTDPEAVVRERAAWVLDNLRDMRAKEVLLQALRDNTWGVRSNAGWGLVHLGQGVADDVQRVAATSDNPDAREMARLVLKRL